MPTIARNEKNLIRTEIEKVLQKVRPMLALHKGNVEFVDFKDGVVYVKLLGTCNGCALSQLTLKAGIEELLKDSIHGIKSVEAVNQGAVTHGPPIQ
ncbi:MAG: NifU family protein [Patescibacteria group bacterium]